MDFVRAICFIYDLESYLRYAGFHINLFHQYKKRETFQKMTTQEDEKTYLSEQASMIYISRYVMCMTQENLVTCI
jgi:hypothetical protein